MDTYKMIGLMMLEIKFVNKKNAKKFQAKIKKENLKQNIAQDIKN